LGLGISYEKHAGTIYFTKNSTNPNCSQALSEAEIRLNCEKIDYNFEKRGTNLAPRLILGWTDSALELGLDSMATDNGLMYSQYTEGFLRIVYFF